MSDKRKKPTGYVATCQCGIVIGAIDLTRSDRKDASKVLGDWVGKGCTLTPRFAGSWSEHVRPCQCDRSADGEGGEG